jgi:hypothetical protein
MSLSETAKFLMEILEGELPSTVLNRVLETGPGMDKYELANVFLTRLIAWTVRFCLRYGIGKASDQLEVCLTNNLMRPCLL